MKIRLNTKRLAIENPMYIDLHKKAIYIKMKIAHAKKHIENRKQTTH